MAIELDGAHRPTAPAGRQCCQPKLDPQGRCHRPRPHDVLRPQPNRDVDVIEPTRSRVPQREARCRHLPACVLQQCGLPSPGRPRITARRTVRHTLAELTRGAIVPPGSDGGAQFLIGVSGGPATSHGTTSGSTVHLCRVPCSPSAATAQAARQRRSRAAPSEPSGAARAANGKAIVHQIGQTSPCEARRYQCAMIHAPQVTQAVCPALRESQREKPNRTDLHKPQTYRNVNQELNLALFARTNVRVSDNLTSSLAGQTFNLRWKKICKCHRVHEVSALPFAAREHGAVSHRLRGTSLPNSARRCFSACVSPTIRACRQRFGRSSHHGREDGGEEASPPAQRPKWDEAEEDIPRMRVCLSIFKLTSTLSLVSPLLATGDACLIQDCTARRHGSSLFWGVLSTRTASGLAHQTCSGPFGWSSVTNDALASPLVAKHRGQFRRLVRAGSAREAYPRLHLSKDQGVRPRCVQRIAAGEPKAGLWVWLLWHDDVDGWPTGKPVSESRSS